MINNINILLFGMIMLYILAIICFYNYSLKNNYSISDILKHCNYDIILIMFLMGILTIIYEFYLINNKKTISSFITIIFLLVGLYGLLLVDNNYLIHYIFAFIVFVSIILYMIFNCYIYNDCYKLKILLLLEIIISIHMLYNFDKKIFNQEVLLLIIFAIYFFIIHIKNIN